MTISYEKPDYVKGFEGPERDNDEKPPVDWFYCYGNGRSALVSQREGEGLHVCLWLKEYPTRIDAVKSAKPNHCFNYKKGGQPTVEGQPHRFAMIATHFLTTDRAEGREGQRRTHV